MNHFDKIKKAVKQSDIGAVMLISEANRFYASGFNSSAGMVVVTEDDAWFFTDSRYFENALKSVADANVMLVDRENSYSGRVNAVLNECGIEKIGFEDEFISYAEYDEFKNKITAELCPFQKNIGDLRAAKDAEELEIMVSAQQIAEKSFNEVLPYISTAATEKDIAAELLYRMLKNGADDKSFDTIVVSGKKSSMPHGVPEDIKISKGFLTIDFGVKYKGYCSDTTRTLCVGEPTAEMRKVYDTVLEAQLAGIAAAKAGVPGCDIDAAARDVITRAGYGENFGHAFGHSLGIEIHESPNASPGSKARIPAGAVISAEPGIYLPGKFGVRIEDVLFITDDGCQNITNLSKELIII